jgi:hypothetical protein
MSDLQKQLKIKDINEFKDFYSPQPNWICLNARGKRKVIDSPASHIIQLRW